jgi:hypothetical protein
MRLRERYSKCCKARVLPVSEAPEGKQVVGLYRCVKCGKNVCGEMLLTRRATRNR